LATSIDNLGDYKSAQGLVELSGNCNNEWNTVALQTFLGENSVWVDEIRILEGNSYSVYFEPPAQGNYTLIVACNGEKIENTSFCYGNCSGGTVTTEEIVSVCGDGTCQSNESSINCPEDCTTTPPPPARCGDGTCQSNESSTNCPADCKAAQDQTPSGGSGGRRTSSCTPQWECGAWSYCNLGLKQSRTCVDSKSCKPAYVEQQACTKCEESWICSGWSECVSAEQVRACQDEHKCGTTSLKPSLRKACVATYVPGPEPVYVSPTIPAPTYYPASEPEPVTPLVKPVTKPVEPFSFAKVWKEYQVIFLGLAIVIVLIIIVIILIAHFAKPKEKAYNVDELKEWIGKERQMGTSDEQVRRILGQNTGWTEEEIARAFNELNMGR